MDRAQSAGAAGGCFDNVSVNLAATTAPAVTFSSGREYAEHPV
jgi:hypothetical protein